MAQTNALLQGVTFNEIHLSPFGSDQDIDGNGIGSSSDEFIELYNTGQVAVDLEGWEFRDGNVLHHTFKEGDVIQPGGYFTLVDPSGGTGQIVNVQGPAVFADATQLVLTPFDTFTLYDPGTDQYIVLAGPDATPGSVSGAIATVENAHPTATESSDIEVLPAEIPGNSMFRDPDGDTNWVTGDPTPGSMNCFLAGTEIATPDGARAIETLQPGDEVLTAEGDARVVKWLWAQPVVMRFNPAERLRPVRIEAGALGEGLPLRDLKLTSDHALYLDGLLINAGALVNGGSIDWMAPDELGRSFTLYHVETEAHDILIAEGTPCESFIDHVGRSAFSGFDAYMARYDEDAAIAQHPAPRLTSARHLPEALKARLRAARAA